jgi:hypothetical protein
LQLCSPAEAVSLVPDVVMDSAAGFAVFVAVLSDGEFLCAALLALHENAMPGSPLYGFLNFVAIYSIFY